MKINKLTDLFGKIAKGQVITDFAMLGLKRSRLFNIPRFSNYIRVSTFELLVSEITRNNISGSVAEVGVYQGGFAQFINRAFPDRDFFLFDTFDGFAEQDVTIEVNREFSNGNQDFRNTSTDLVLSKMTTPEKCHIRTGYFPDTAVGLDDRLFCFVSLDADLYKPILDGLKFFYPRLAKGGYIMVHDFNNDHYAGARKAVEEFCAIHRIPFVPIPDPWGTVIIGK